MIYFAVLSPILSVAATFLLFRHMVIEKQNYIRERVFPVLERNNNVLESLQKYLSNDAARLGSSTNPYVQSIPPETPQVGDHWVQIDPGE